MGLGLSALPERGGLSYGYWNWRLRVWNVAGKGFCALQWLNFLVEEGKGGGDDYGSKTWSWVGGCPKYPGKPINSGLNCNGPGFGSELRFFQETIL